MFRRAGAVTLCSYRQQERALIDNYRVQEMEYDIDHEIHKMDGQEQKLLHDEGKCYDIDWELVQED